MPDDRSKTTISESLREQVAASIYENRRAEYNKFRTDHLWLCPWSDYPPAYRKDYYADADAALAVVLHLTLHDNHWEGPILVAVLGASTIVAIGSLIYSWWTW